MPEMQDAKWRPTRTGRPAKDRLPQETVKIISTQILAVCGQWTEFYSRAHDAATKANFWGCGRHTKEQIDNLFIKGLAPSETSRRHLQPLANQIIRVLFPALAIYLPAVEKVPPPMLRISSVAKGVKIYDNNSALLALCDAISKATAAYNTTISSADAAQALPTAASLRHWRAAVVRAIKRGLIFQDVVSSHPPYVSMILERAASVAGRLGIYEATETDCAITFLNFTVLEYGPDAGEVFFGWLMEKGSDLGGKCVSTTEPHTVALFRHWFRTLFEGGRYLYPHPAKKSTTRQKARH